jgi:hypothetical protein
MAGNHVFDDYPKKFGMTKRQAHLIREYFQLSNPLENSINELYDLFPDFMQGEPLFRIEFPSRLGSHVPLYSKDEITNPN